MWMTTAVVPQERKRHIECEKEKRIMVFEGVYLGSVQRRVF